MSSSKFKDPFVLVAEILDCDPNTLSATTVLTDHPNWDSFNHLKLLVALEESYGVNISDETLEAYSKMKAILEKYKDLIQSP